MINNKEVRTDMEVSEYLKHYFREIFLKEKHFIVEYPVEGKVHRYIVPLTEDDEYNVKSHAHFPIPPDTKILCMDMDMYLNYYLMADEPDIPEIKPYSEAIAKKMYIFPQEVKE